MPSEKTWTASSCARIVQNSHKSHSKASKSYYSITDIDISAAQFGIRRGKPNVSGKMYMVQLQDLISST